MSKCSVCNKELGLFNRKFICKGGGKLFCSDHIYAVSFGKHEVKDLYEINFHVSPEFSVTKFNYVLCKDCKETFDKQIKRIDSAFENYYDIRTYTINYQGKANNGPHERMLVSDWHRDKSKCLIELKVLAKSLGYKKVIQIETDSDVAEEETEKGGTYRYRIFQMKGYACL